MVRRRSVRFRSEYLVNHLLHTAINLQMQGSLMLNPKQPESWGHDHFACINHSDPATVKSDTSSSCCHTNLHHVLLATDCCLSGNREVFLGSACQMPANRSTTRSAAGASQMFSIHNVILYWLTSSCAFKSVSFRTAHAKTICHVHYLRTLQYSPTTIRVMSVAAVCMIESCQKLHLWSYGSTWQRLSIHKWWGKLGGKKHLPTHMDTKPHKAKPARTQQCHSRHIRLPQLRQHKRCLVHLIWTALAYSILRTVIVTCIQQHRLSTTKWTLHQCWCPRHSVPSPLIHYCLMPKC